MTDVPWSNSELDELIEAYRRAASAHGLGSVIGDFKDANAQAEIVARVYRELRRRGQLAQQALLPLMDDDDEGVRGWAAAAADRRLFGLTPLDGLSGKPLVPRRSVLIGRCGLNERTTWYR